MPEELILKQMAVGPMGNFIYFLGDAQSKEIAVVDPAWDVDYLCNEAEKNGYKIAVVLLTHGHPDHVNGLKTILARHDVPACISRHEAFFLKPKHKNITEIDDRQNVKIGRLEIQCLLTPGHTPGCQCLLYKNVLISGDTLFIDGCGRCDLPGSDPQQMYHSLYNVISRLPDDTVIYPGHNYGPVPSATLGSQKKTNPYLTCAGIEEFLSERMGV